MQHLLLQFAQAVAGGGAELQAEAVAGLVAADTVRTRRPPRVLQERLGTRQIEFHRRDFRIVVRAERIDPGGGDRLREVEQPVHHRLSIHRHQQGSAHPHIAEQGVLLLQVDMFVGQAWLEGVLELIRVLLLQRQHLIDGQADALAGDHIHVAAQ